MDARSNTAAESTDCALIVTRVFDAPRELVWKASPSPSASNIGGGRKASPRASTNSSYAPAVLFFTASETPEASRCGASGSIAKSSRRSVW